MVDDLGKVKDNVTKIVKDIVVAKEKFSLKKFMGGFNIFRPKVMAKWLTSTIRTILILSIIFGGIYGVGYWRGIHNKPINIELGRGKEAFIKIDGHYLHITDEGTVFIEDMEGNRIKQISAKDIKGLEAELRQFGFQLEPIVVAGAGFGKDGIEGEVGAGFSWFRAWKLNIDSFLTQRGIYPIGLSYSLKDLRLKNSSTGIAAGTGYKSFRGERDTRIIWYWRTKF